MGRSVKEARSLKRVAVIGNYVPRRCGIATFTTDLCEAMMAAAPEVQVSAVAINDVPQGYDYPPTVRFEISQNKLADYRLAADFLNMNQFDLVCVQHEYGVFGGITGSDVLILLRRLRMPIITTLHTVLKNPSEEQRLVLNELAGLSDRVVVMSNTAVGFLKEIYKVPESKIVLVHHGIPDVPFVDSNYYKDHFGVEGRRVILTFGLLSPGKGIEYMIEALPTIVDRYPDVVYIILGATHPNIKRTSGEEYRLGLQRRVVDLGLDESVVFHNRFVQIEELCEFLGAADIYVTPYLDEAQIVSGTLAYALGSGKAVVSTPYWYAQDMLAEKRGRLVPFRNAEQLASECAYLFSHEVERNAMRKRAYMYTREMVWKEVARRYQKVFAETKAERKTKPRRAHGPKRFEPYGRELPEINLSHLRVMTDDTGILQHAKYTVPDRNDGYCTDDNARALVVTLEAEEFFSEDRSLDVLASRYLSFLHYAFHEESGRFRNFMTFDRKWVSKSGSEDSHGRALWGLGFAVVSEQSKGQRRLATELFQRALPVVTEFTSPRAWAFSLVGIHYYLKRLHGASEARRVQRILASRLYKAFQQNATDDWPWPENNLSYANGKFPHAMLLAGGDLEDSKMTEMALRSLDWLIGIQSGFDGCFSPVGTTGGYERGGVRARFDQQPIEAHAMLEACIEAYTVTREDRWLKAARRCLDWFLGKNDLELPLYDYTSGGCRDGLHPDRANENQGAESTLGWLLSLLAMYRYGSKYPLVSAGEPLEDDVPDVAEEATAGSASKGRAKASRRRK